MHGVDGWITSDPDYPERCISTSVAMMIAKAMPPFDFAVRSVFDTVTNIRSRMQTRARIGKEDLVVFKGFPVHRSVAPATDLGRDGAATTVSHPSGGGRPESSGAAFDPYAGAPEAGVGVFDDCRADARTPHDRRIARYEAAHLTVGTVLFGGHSFAGATIEADDRCSGRVWALRHETRFANEVTSAIVTALNRVMPQDGESRMDAADVYAHCLLRITELAAGSEAERMHFGDAWPALDDRRQERELASLIASSQESVEALIGFSQLEAASILAGMRMSPLPWPMRSCVSARSIPRKSAAAGEMAKADESAPAVSLRQLSDD